MPFAFALLKRRVLDLLYFYIWSTNMLLKNQVAIVTGGASTRGIGWATAKRFADEGARVVILDLDGSAAQSAAAANGESAPGLCVRCTR